MKLKFPFPFSKLVSDKVQQKLYRANFVFFGILVKFLLVGGGNELRHFGSLSIALTAMEDNKHPTLCQKPHLVKTKLGPHIY